jgi:hypothetical protein
MHVDVQKGHTVKTFTMSSTGEQRTIFVQNALLVFDPADPFKNKNFALSHDSAADELPAGQYAFAPEAFAVNEYGALKMAFRPVLVPSPDAMSIIARSKPAG